jgi:cytochrome c oxidase subunit 1
MLNMISSMGVFVLGASVLPFLRAVFRSLRYGEPVDRTTPTIPGATANSLEWATSCPPLRHLHRTAPYPIRVPGLRAALAADGRDADEPHQQ